MKSYCVKEKRETECVPGTEKTRTASNGRQMMVCKCASCGITKTTFMANRKAAKRLPGRKSITDRNKERANALRAIIRERQNVEHGMIKAKVSRAALNAFNKETNRLIDQLVDLEKHIGGLDSQVDRRFRDEYMFIDPVKPPKVDKRFRREYMFEDDPMDSFRERYMFMDPVKPPKVDKRFRKEYMFEDDPRDLFRERYMFIDPVKPPKVDKRFRKEYMFQDESPVLTSDPKSWKNTTGLTPAIIKKRMNRYYNIDDNPADMKKVKNLLDKITAKKPGSVTKLGLIDIKKLDKFQYMIQYWARMMRDAKPIKQNYLLVDRIGLMDFLKKYVAGVFAFSNDQLVFITQL